MVARSVKRIIRLTLPILLIVSSVLLQSQTDDRKGILLHVNDAIGPATSDYLASGLRQAANRGAEIVVIQMDTPGGLDLAMRDIIRNILASPVPVAIYVSPPGARAASAGTYMLYAAHVAAMAPGTNLGAATPVQLGGAPDLDRQLPDTDATQDKDGAVPVDNTARDPMASKMVNDAVAYIRSLAELRGRNVDWAEKAVREASSLSSTRALEMNVIDLVVTNVGELLASIDGRTVIIDGKPISLETAGLELDEINPDWRNQLLAVITNPNIAYILMLLGIYGLFFELANPGFIFPGVIGAISLLLALYSMQVLPVNYAGLGLILLGIAFMVAEVFAPSFGVLGIGGVISFVTGSIILFDREGGGMAISIPVIVSISIISTGFFFIIVRSAVRAYRKPVVSGREQMIGTIGEVAEDFQGEGHILIHGEHWRAESSIPVHKGQKAIVTEMNGLVLQITPKEHR